MAILNLLQNTVSTLGKDQFNYPIEPYFPFRATGGFMETFTTGGIEYTMHSFTTPGTSSFEVLQGNANIGVLLIGGGGAGNGPQRPTPGDYRGAVGGGAGGLLEFRVDNYTSLFVRKDPNAGVQSIFEVCVGGGGRAETFGYDISLANSTASTFVKKYDEIGYYCPYYNIYASGGGNGFGGSGSSGAGFGAGTPGQGNNGGTEDAFSGGGGAGSVGGNSSGFGNYSGIGGDGLTVQPYWGGTSGSYVVSVAGGGSAGGAWESPTAGGLFQLYGYSGSFGSGAGGGWQIGPGQGPPTLTQLSGSNGVANTGGGGGGGMFFVNGSTTVLGQGGNGGSGVVRIIYQTQN